jgi:hypothetical protein
MKPNIVEQPLSAYLGFMLLQQVPHTLHAAMHDDAEFAVWGVGTYAVHGHDVLMRVYQYQLKAVNRTGTNTMKEAPEKATMIEGQQGHAALECARGAALQLFVWRR